MAIYKLSYAAEHLPELFQEAHDDGDVFILRPDGLTCELVPMTRTFVTDPMLESEAIPAAAMRGELLPT